MAERPRVDFRLLLITDRHLVSNLEAAVDDACRAGIRAVQLREKDLSGRALLDYAKRLQVATKRHNADLFVNDRSDVALACGARGVHCPERGIKPSTAKRLLGDDAQVGASTHSLAGLRNAERDDADFALFGPIFETPSKTRFGEPHGLDTLRVACETVRFPVFAVGGVDAGRARECLAAGAAGVAVISAILGQKSITDAVDLFRSQLGTL